MALPPPTSNPARFVRPPGGSPLSNQTLTLTTGGTVDIGVTRKKIPGSPFPGGNIQVAPDGAAKFTGRVNFVPSGFQAETTVYKVTGFRPGTVRLLAFEGATIHDNVQFQVVGPELASMTILDALDNRSLVINEGDANVLRAAIKGSQTTQVHEAILELIAAMIRAGGVGVLSLMRKGEGQHGVEKGGATIVRAVDFHSFKGTPINSTGGQALVDLICDMLKLFPKFGYDLGFPRPVGGANGFDPTFDVFFSVPDQATAQQCWDGTISRSLQQMLSPAKAKVAAAMAASEATFHVLFPDGLNHLHVAVTRTPDIVTNTTV